MNTMMMFHLSDDDKKEDAIVVRVHGTGLDDISSRERELSFQQVSTSFCYRSPRRYRRRRLGLIGLT